jgi:hypothetical protein
MFFNEVSEWRDLDRSTCDAVSFTIEGERFNCSNPPLGVRLKCPVHLFIFNEIDCCHVFATSSSDMFFIT